MSMYIDFEPHSWYMYFAIKYNHNRPIGAVERRWSAYTDNGDTYHVDEIHAYTLKQLKFKIREYYLAQSKGDCNKMPIRLVKPLMLHHVRTNIPF